MPDAPFEYSFLDQNFDALFRAEQRMSQVILVFTVLAIIIALSRPVRPCCLHRRAAGERDFHPQGHGCLRVAGNGADN